VITWRIDAQQNIQNYPHQVTLRTLSWMWLCIVRMLASLAHFIHAEQKKRTCHKFCEDLSPALKLSEQNCGGVAIGGRFCADPALSILLNMLRDVQLLA
jgi:hypothetical protein